MKKRIVLLTLLSSMMLIFFVACEPPAPGPGFPGPGNTPGISTGDSDVFGNGPYRAANDQNSGANRSSGVHYPADLSQGPFPVFVWGAGAGTGPRQYIEHMNKIASHGFICISNASNNNGRMHTQAINWIVRQNETQGSKFYGAVDTSKIAAGGHSMGSIGTFAIASNPQLTTTVHVAGGSFDGNGSRNLRKPAIYITGSSDMARSNCERDYQRTSNVPVFFTLMQGVDHIMCAREGLPAMIAWLKWFLNDEQEMQSMFLNQSGPFCTGKFNCKFKNWN